MVDLPKRVWSGKKQVYSWKKSVWVKDWKLWVYDPNFEEVTNWQYYSPNRWGNVSSDAELQIYDDKDSLNPTDIGTFEDWLESTYQFVDYDGTVLKSWKVKDWETPVAPADPTRPETAAATYTFSGWNPTVGPINKNTEYVAQYEETLKNYTVTILVNPEWAGTVDIQQVTVPYGSTIFPYGNLLHIWADVVTATAETWYRFSSWGTSPEMVTENLTITAEFAPADYTVTILVNPEWAGTVDIQQVTVPYGSLIGFSDNQLAVGDYEITATAESWYTFYDWGTLPEMVTEDINIIATFVAAATVQIWVIDMEKQVWYWGTVNPTSIVLPIWEQYSIEDSSMPQDEGATWFITINWEDITLSCTSSFQYTKSVYINGVEYFTDRTSALPNVTQWDVIRFILFGWTS